MSGQDINPFASPEDVNPFAGADSPNTDSKVDMTNEFNPFAVQNEPPPPPQATPTSPANKPKSPTFSDSPAPVYQAQSTPKPVSSPATIEPAWMNPSPVVKQQQPQQQSSSFRGYGSTTDDMQQKQEELDRKAEELDRKEAELRKRQADGDGRNNFPPLPKCCCVGPCFYHDINMDIPVEYQRTCRMLFISWQLYVLALFMNVLSALAGVIEGYDDTPMLFGIALLYFVLFPIMSFVCWYRPVYKALRSNSSFNFFMFFFVFFCQTVLMFVYALGINSIGTCGWINASKIASGGNHGVSIMFFITAALFTLLVFVYAYLLRRVHQIFRSSGATMQKAQKEFAEGMASNKTVQKAAVDTVAAGIASQP